MSDSLRILLLEDSPTDAELNEHLLRKAGINFTSLRVETRTAFVAALDTFRPDIILADYKLPEFDGMAALQIVRRDHPEVPVIMVTGVLSDIEAVELIHAGAKDYMLKDRPARLAAAVQRALSIEQGIRARKMAEEKFRKISESAQDAIIMMGTDQCISFWNAAAERIFGYTAAEAMGQELHALIVPAPAHAQFSQAFPHFQKTGKGPIVGQLRELIALRKGGEEFSVELSVSATQFGGQWHAIGIVRDITERKQAVEKILKNEAQIKAVLESLTESVVVLDTSGTVVSANDAATKLFGRTLEEFIDPETDPRWKIIHSDGSLFPVEEQPAIVALRTGAPVQNVEMGVPLPDGTFRWVLVNAQLMRDISGTTLGVVASSYDITERKKAEKALRVSALKHQLLFESSRDALMTLAPPSWKFTGANQATVQLFGASSVAEFTALGPWNVSPERQPDGRPSGEKAQEMIAIAMREGSHFFEWEHQRLDGQPFAADVLLTRMEVGEDVFLQATVRDIAARKQAEAQIAEQLNELRRWYDATLGQGMRNIELKREVNELLKQAGQPPRYPNTEPSNPE